MGEGVHEVVRAAQQLPNPPAGIHPEPAEHGGELGVGGGSGLFVVEGWEGAISKADKFGGESKYNSFYEADCI